MSLALADAMLLLSLLFVRPVADGAWSLRLLLHALLLAVWLGVESFTASSPARCLVALVAVLAQAGVARLWLRRESASRRRGGRDAVWLLAGLLLIGLAIRLVPASAMPPLPRQVLVVSLGILLTGLLAALAATAPPGRCAALLLAGDGLVMAAGTLPGMDALSLAGVLLLQASLLWLLHRATARQGERAEPGAPGEAT